MGKAILVVEDDKDIREILCKALDMLGFEVKAAENGQIALKLLLESDFKPGLILLDLMMPVMDGFEFHQNQKNDPRISHIPVIVVTADGQANQKSDRMGAQGGLSKPIDINDLAAVAAKFCS